MEEKTNINSVVQEIIVAVNQMRKPIDLKQEFNLLTLADELDENIRRLGQLISHYEKECDNQYGDLEASLRNLSMAKEIAYEGSTPDYPRDKQQDELNQLLAIVAHDLNRYINS